MFGNPIERHGDWSFGRIDAFCDVVTGNTPSRKNPEYYGDGIEWIKTDNITEAAYLTKASECLSSEGERVGRVAPAGSVLMACIAGSVKSIGKVAIADRPIAFNQQINALVPHEGTIETEYLLWMLRLSKDYLCSDISMQLKGILNKSNLSKKSFSIPPLTLQQEFVAFVRKVDKLKFETTQSTAVPMDTQRRACIFVPKMIHNKSDLVRKLLLFGVLFFSFRTDSFSDALLCLRRAT